jgi:hypothetical protein
MAKLMDIFEMGEEIAAQHRAQAARDDADPAYQAALKATTAASPRCWYMTNRTLH